MANPLIDSLTRAVEAQPGDVSLRLHLAGLLLAEGMAAETIRHCAVILQQEPGNSEAQQLLASAANPQQPSEEVNPAPPAAPIPAWARPGVGSPATGGNDSSADPPTPPNSSEFDWDQAAKQFENAPDPRFVGVSAAEASEAAPPEELWEIETAGITLADVGGMEAVKERLEVSFLAPLRNPELRRLYGKRLRGGLLLYGPPGCGKTYIARAVAGEMGAGFMSVTLSDVLDKYLGQSEGNLHGLFELARSRTPMVIFLDELDAVGHKRTRNSNQSLRNVVNQLLQELDGVSSDNEGVYVLAATNAPWDIDPALRRPGRLDRSVAVLPPDGPARAAILRHELARRPIEGIDLDRLSRDTEGFTGADLSYLCESAAELALMDSVRSGQPRMITMKDLNAARKQLRPSAAAWFESARNVVVYADATNEYAELASYMKRHKLL